MFWITIVVISLGTLLIKLGALSVAVAVLAAAFKVSLFVIVILAGLLVWRWYRGRRVSWRKL